MTNLFDTYNTELWQEFAAETRAHNAAQYKARDEARAQREQDYAVRHSDWAQLSLWKRWFTPEPQPYWLSHYYVELSPFIRPVTVDAFLAWVDQRKDVEIELP